MGCRSELGGSPLASSMAVIPRDQISAWGGKVKSVRRGVLTSNTDAVKCVDLFILPMLKNVLQCLSASTNNNTLSLCGLDVPPKWNIFFTQKWEEENKQTNLQTALTQTHGVSCPAHRLWPHLEVVGGLFDNLWSHPERCAHKCVPLNLGVCQLPRHPEICQLHVALLRQEHVGS